jgi:hypothetical protein
MLAYPESSAYVFKEEDKFLLSSLRASMGWDHVRPAFLWRIRLCLKI